MKTIKDNVTQERIRKIYCVTQYFPVQTHRSGNAQRQGTGPPVPTSDKIRTI